VKISDICAGPILADHNPGAPPMRRLLHVHNNGLQKNR